VNLRASWCPPCRAEMPGIEALYKNVDHSKVVFVMLSLDDAAKAQKFVKAKGVYLPLTLPYYFYYLISSKLSRNPVQQRFNQVGQRVIGPD